ncbi:hypothetical protein TEA_025426 [Camellia sinensis var. sinensis]|uniref:Uncharacterized protein n=1 Tax=Camellia sinensis var. sinensis TaxID=542762 RepID=A0A4S4DNE1_CAMSN|nr:hypothetical protein TEA_025426 [Camellia sinensis var. sinensis]
MCRKVIAFAHFLICIFPSFKPDNQYLSSLLSLTDQIANAKLNMHIKPIISSMHNGLLRKKLRIRTSGIADEGDPKSSEELFTESGNEKSLDNLIPKSETDFLEYANLISQKLHQYEVNARYFQTLKLWEKSSMLQLFWVDLQEDYDKLLAYPRRIRHESTGGRGGIFRLLLGGDGGGANDEKGSAKLHANQFAISVAIHTGETSKSSKISKSSTDILRVVGFNTGSMTF